MDRADHDQFDVTPGLNGAGRAIVVAAHWSGDALPGEVARLRAAAGTFATRLGASDALVADVRIAVSEALSNVIMHAFPGAPGRLYTRANADPTSGLVTFSVRDYGIGFGPRPDGPGMGMGVGIMTALSHAIEIAAPADGGTEVHLTFAVPPAASDHLV
jgi:serine/threonine-protein kinase RsbW